MKKIILTLLLTLSLIGAGCGSKDDGKNIQATTKKEYETDAFSLNPPKNWEKIETFTKEYPAGVKAGFREPIKDNNFTANINITTKSVNANLNSYDFALQEIKNHENNLKNYLEITREKRTIKIGGNDTDTILITFEGRQNIENDMNRFLQIFATKEGIGYVVTGGLSQDESSDVQKEIEESLKSFEIQ
ncbi:hypothetical protein HYV57_00415 [Candidatus Peregrinibacteria bacterium]|nr:hypothetical protein [Candidatus Peregrinibacteria bacterium]